MMTTEHIEPTQEGIAHAASLIRGGGVVAFPTETVYGLGGDALDDRSVAKIYQAKGRPSFNPLILHLPSIEAISEYAVLGDTALALASAFWPGPLTLVLPQKANSRVSKLATAGLDSLAVRVPQHSIARALLRAVDRPVAAPSANPSGKISPTTASHVLNGLAGRISAVLDAGPCAVGVESTIVDVTGKPRLLRPGGITLEALTEVVGEIAAGDIEPLITPSAPGQLASHYAPKAPVRLEAISPSPGEAFLGFGGSKGATLDLSPTGDLLEACANLFSMLHQLDDIGRPIAVAPIPDIGLGRAINDRLRRAAAPRS